MIMEALEERHDRLNEPDRIEKLAEAFPKAENNGSRILLFTRRLIRFGAAVCRPSPKSFAIA